MVRIKQKLRHAFTMIELIFAIVIIAISVMSLPMMTQVISASMEKNLIQEAIFASVAEINLATSYVWDENSLIDASDTSSSDVDELSRVILDEVTGTKDCQAVGIFMKRKGHINRTCLENATTRMYTATVTPAVYVDSLEASNHNWADTFEGEVTIGSSQGYKKMYQSRLTVNRCDLVGVNCKSFGNITGTNVKNLKEITIEMREKGTTDVVTLLRTYSTNIGEVAYHSKLL